MKKSEMTWPILAFIAVLSVIYINLLYPWMENWGLSEAEAHMALPGDGIQPELVATSTRGITIHAPAEEVWQWVVQLGQSQAGFYSNDWLENLFLADIHNQNVIQPEWQTHRQGEPVYGAGGVVYQKNWSWPTQVYEAGKMIYLWGPIVVLSVDRQTTLLVTRSYAKPTTLVNQLSYDWMHFVMERGMLLGIKARAEGRLFVNSYVEIASKIGWILSSLGFGWFLFARRRGWAWGLIPLAYTCVILAVTCDVWAALAGFMWWGVITAGFVVLGRVWWQWLALATALVILIFVLAPQPHTTFGILFLAITIGFLTRRLVPILRPARKVYGI